ncbi:nickel import ATP-binding protein NikD [Oceanidesulfovibrio indonesiensis]|uniref:Nickel import ATP-binding protein NikD n=1 Tax=Oceanidesulfovibrio indonesiensis TaxID=54767 RepID=A0A7M3MD24_9BACT|nr:ABC transporter ATP-binding protein [Oceanidesulfovibrio indonesiensis]TVM15985.1 nickel import ATP-binding protein NikD [Oceanidesulfovibrio indonesiensis]
MSEIIEHGGRVYLDVQDLAVFAGSKKLVRGISFHADTGQVTGLVGESGSGKSLTCQTIMGLVPKGLSASGSVRLGGEAMPVCAGNTVKTRQARGKRMAIIMQNPMSCFDPVFTIRAHFKETLSAHGAPASENGPERWRKSLAEVGFPEPDSILKLYPFQMSGGMLQRVMIALALLLDVDFLLADEATTDLDAVSQARVLDLIDTLVRDRGLGVLLVTHDLSVIARLADKVLVMHDGSIVERGSVRSIFHAPRHEYTASLLEAHYRLYGMTSHRAARDVRADEGACMN